MMCVYRLHQLQTQIVINLSKTLLWAWFPWRLKENTAAFMFCTLITLLRRPCEETRAWHLEADGKVDTATLAPLRSD